MWVVAGSFFWAVSQLPYSVTTTPYAQFPFILEVILMVHRCTAAVIPSVTHCKAPSAERIHIECDSRLWGWFNLLICFLPWSRRSWPLVFELQSCMTYNVPCESCANKIVDHWCFVADLYHHSPKGVTLPATARLTREGWSALTNSMDCWSVPFLWSSDDPLKLEMFSTDVIEVDCFEGTFQRMEYLCRYFWRTKELVVHQPRGITPSRLR